MLIKTNANKLLVSTLLIAFLSIPLVSMALATPDDNSAATDDGQMLIAPAPEDEPAPTSDQSPVLIQQRDSDTNATDSSTTPTEGKSGDEPNLIATNTKSDSNVLIAGTVAIASAIALGASFAVIRRRRK
jgi:hypothetical protein